MGAVDAHWDTCDDEEEEFYSCLGYSDSIEEKLSELDFSDTDF